MGLLVIPRVHGDATIKWAATDHTRDRHNHGRMPSLTQRPGNLKNLHSKPQISASSGRSSYQTQFTPRKRFTGSVADGKLQGSKLGKDSRGKSATIAPFEAETETLKAQSWVKRGSAKTRPVAVVFWPGVTRVKSGKTLPLALR